MTVELLAYKRPQPTGQPSTSRGRLGITHLSFYVDDVDAAAAHLVTLGGTILEDTRGNPGVELVFLADPDGTRVELMQG
jgi:lactoylglutathione lyase